MYTIAATTLALIVLVIAQFIKRSKRLVSILWGVLAALIVVGPAGTSVGLTQAGMALEAAHPEVVTEALGTGIAIANVTTSYGLIVSFFLAILVGIANSRVISDK